jgi:DNA repair protein SbcD/Mre11
MKVLHTSDWHLGHQLIQQKRDDEHSRFLDWLLELIRSEGVELLIVAGDVFDSGLPPSYALELYYTFLAGSMSAGCRNLVVVAGNHDSPAVLQAPREVLRALNILVVGSVGQSPGKECLLTAVNKDGAPAAIVCAVPFLRDREVYSPRLGDPIEVRDRRIIEGTGACYRNFAEIAVEMREGLGISDLPIIATGHLFAQGSSVGSAERELYVGNLGAFPADGFPGEFSYVALGHLHRAQVCGRNPRVRYSGSPVPLSFAEAETPRQVVVFDSANPLDAVSVEVPVFRNLARVRGNLAEIGEGLRRVQSGSLEAWVDVLHTGEETFPDLQERVNGLSEGLPIQIISCRDIERASQVSEYSGAEISDLKPEDVFRLRLEQHNFSDPEREAVVSAFNELLHKVCQEDLEA